MTRFRSLLMLGCSCFIPAAVVVGALAVRGWPWHADNPVIHEQPGPQLQKAGALVDRIMADANADSNGQLSTLLRGSVPSPWNVSGAKPANVWFMSSSFAPLGTGSAPAPDRIASPAIILTGEILAAAAAADPQVAAALDAWPQADSEWMTLPVRIFRDDEKAVYHRNDVVVLITSDAVGVDISGIVPKRGDHASKLTWCLCTADPAPGDNSPTPNPRSSVKNNPWIGLLDTAPKPAWDAGTAFTARTLVQTADPSSPLPQLWLALDDNRGIDPRTDHAGHWRALSHAVRMPLDQYGNPMVLAPCGGLSELHSDHFPNYDYGHTYRPGDQIIYKLPGSRNFYDEFWTCSTAPPSAGFPPLEKPTEIDPQYWFRGVAAPDHRCFWASAGPDGDFCNADDNQYSFVK